MSESHGTNGDTLTRLKSFNKKVCKKTRFYYAYKALVNIYVYLS